MFRFDPFSPQIDADPFPAYRRLREEFPCFWSEEANAWILSRFADIVVALNDWPRFSSAKGNNVAELPNRAGGTLGTTDPPRHDQLRALIQYAFVKRNLDSLTGPIRDLAREAAEALRGRKRFDFVGHLPPAGEGARHRRRASNRRPRPHDPQSLIDISITVQCGGRHVGRCDRGCDVSF